MAGSPTIGFAFDYIRVMAMSQPAEAVTTPTYNDRGRDNNDDDDDNQPFSRCYEPCGRRRRNGNVNF